MQILRSAQNDRLSRERTDQILRSAQNDRLSRERTAQILRFAQNDIRRYLPGASRGWGFKFSTI
jgi:hypothetical protein